MLSHEEPAFGVIPTTLWPIAVLIFGDFQGFDQRYVTLSLELPCPGWSLVIGDFEARLPLCRLREPTALSPVCALPHRRCCTP